MQTYKVTLDVSETMSHFGADTAGIGVEKVMEWVHSDTLFSAIAHAYAKKLGFDKTKTLFETFHKKDEEIPFRCSSAFLAKYELVFVPKPKLPLPESCDWSALFKVKFISLQNLYKWLGLVPMKWNVPAEVDEFLNSITQDAKTYRELFIDRVRAVNAKSRLHNQTQVYHRGETIYTAGTQLYFFLEVSAAFEDKLREALQFLADYTGLGGEINVGFSHIKGIKWEPFSFPIPQNRRGVYLMSLYPVYAEVDWDSAWYDLLTRKSWFHSPFHGVQLKKKAVKMVTEGSCLPSLPKPGKLLDVSPGEWLKLEGNGQWHRIYRNGLAFSIEY